MLTWQGVGHPVPSTLPFPADGQWLLWKSHLWLPSTGRPLEGHCRNAQKIYQPWLLHPRSLTRKLLVYPSKGVNRLQSQVLPQGLWLLKEQRVKKGFRAGGRKVQKELFFFFPLSWTWEEGQIGKSLELRSKWKGRKRNQQVTYKRQSPLKYFDSFSPQTMFWDDINLPFL